MAADIEAALVTFLRNDPGVFALTDGGRRIYPENAPQKVGYPRVVYLLQSTAEQATLKGSSDQPTATFELECYAEGVQGQGTGNRDALALADAVQDATGGLPDAQALKSFGPGWMPAVGVVGAVWVKQCRLQDNGGGMAEQGVGGDRKWIHKRTLTLTVSYNRAAFDQ